MVIPLYWKEIYNMKDAVDDHKILEQNFGLSKFDFDELLHKMKLGDKALFEKIFLYQFSNSHQYLKIKYNIDDALAYDCTMEALLKLRTKLLEGKVEYGNLRFLFSKMAGQFLSDLTRKKTSTYIPEEDHRLIPVEQENIILDRLEKCWKSLGDECKNLLQEFYYNRKMLKHLAEEMGRKETYIRKRKQRCLEKLRSLFQQQAGKIANA